MYNYMTNATSVNEADTGLEPVRCCWWCGSPETDSHLPGCPGMRGGACDRVPSNETTAIRAEAEFWANETETPSSWEDGRCVHVGLFAHGAPSVGTPAYDAWLATTVPCGHCGHNVPNREL